MSPTAYCCELLAAIWVSFCYSFHHCTSIETLFSAPKTILSLLLLNARILNNALVANMMLKNTAEST